MLRLLPLLVLALAAPACGGGGGGAAADADAAGGAPDLAAAQASFGSACTVDDDCATGLCLASDHAPRPWCSRPCAAEQAGDFCPTVVGEAPSVCIEYPDAAHDPLGEGFRSRADVRRFCAPWCADDAECRALHADLVCLPPEWRGNPLYPDRDHRICRGETIGGYTGEDPDECAGWADDSRFAEAVAVCTDYCEYLAACRELPESLGEDCCGRACHERMTVEGRIDADYSRALSCFVDYFNAFRETGLVCTEPRDRCGAPPIPE